MLIIGLTGGIGSGKSTVATLFAALGAPVIDADLIARKMVNDEAMLTKISAHFGMAVLDQRGQLNRAWLAQCVFADPSQRKWLEQLLHPQIAAEIKRRILQLDTSYCVVVIPLLAETVTAQQLVERVLVVDAPEAQQIARTMRRDKLALTEVRAILASQVGREQRLSIADDVIYNSGDIPALQQAVLDLHHKYSQH